MRIVADRLRILQPGVSPHAVRGCAPVRARRPRTQGGSPDRIRPTLPRIGPVVVRNTKARGRLDLRRPQEHS